MLPIKVRKALKPVKTPVTEVDVQVQTPADDGACVVSDFDPDAVDAAASKLLKMSTYEPDYVYWLDVEEHINAVLGSKNKGLCYGKMIEIAGINHGGKTLLSQVIAGLGQADGAVVGYIDLENSRDEMWGRKLGMAWEKVMFVYPKLVIPKPAKTEGEPAPPAKGKGKKKKPSTGLPRLQSIEELFAEAETKMALASKAGFKKQIWIIDSIANIQTEMQVEAGPDGQNMRTKLDRASFLSSNLPRWTGLAANYNAMVLLINQIRTKQGMVFGDPTYTPGGNALEHTCSVRVRLRRIKNHRKNGKVVGLLAVIKNYKNKAGEGSVQDEQCGFSVIWHGPKAKVEFMSLEEAEEAKKGEGQ